MRDINTESKNVITMTGKVLGISFRTGKNKDGKPYEMAMLTLRVEQDYLGIHEVNEIPVSIYASKFKNDGTISPAYDNLQKMKDIKTVQKVGFEAADRIRFTSGRLEENNYLTKTGNFISTWAVRPSLVSINPSAADCATFNEDIFIMDMREEMDRESEPTGRLIIKGGIVRYGGSLNVVDFIVENPDGVDAIQANYEPNQTMNISGRIRYTSVEEKHPVSASSGWGETLTSTRKVRELIVTNDGGEPFDDDMAYDPVEIKKAFNERKARLEQLQLNAKQKATPAAPSPAKKVYDWE